MSADGFEFAHKEERIQRYTPLSIIGIRVGELQTLLAALRAIAANAEAWHCDEAGKDRALAVIAEWARRPSTVPPGVVEALPSPSFTEQQ